MLWWKLQRRDREHLVPATEKHKKEHNYELSGERDSPEDEKPTPNYNGYDATTSTRVAIAVDCEIQTDITSELLRHRHNRELPPPQCRQNKVLIKADASHATMRLHPPAASFTVSPLSLNTLTGLEINGRLQRPGGEEHAMYCAKDDLRRCGMQLHVEDGRRNKAGGFRSSRI